MAKGPDIYKLAIEHIQPAQGDVTLVRQYVDAAAAMVENLTGLRLLGLDKHAELVFPIQSVERPMKPLFRVPGQGARVGARLRVPTLIDPMDVDVSLVSRGRKIHLGRRTIVNGYLCLDPVEGGCCVDDCSAILVRLPTITDDDWPPHVKQAVLQVAKWLYEHRGDSGQGASQAPKSILWASGAAELLAGYLQ